MNDRDRLIIDRIKIETRFVDDSIDDIDETAFLQNEQLQHLVLTTARVIGSFGGKLSDNFKNQYQEIQ